MIPHEIEGILISKTPFQDRHLIGHLLSRQGNRVPLLFYGGQAGGKKKKSSTLELGHLLKVELQRSQSGQELYKAKDWKLNWAPQKMRENHKAFYLMCFFLEVLQKISLTEEVSEREEHQGLFLVLSNALFYLEDSLKNEKFYPSVHFNFFLGKLLLQLGIQPQISECLSCQKVLTSKASFCPDEAGFYCSDCYQNYSQTKALSQFHQELQWIFTQKYSNYRDFLSFKHSDLLKQFFLLQIDVAENTLKTLKNIT